MRYVLLLRGINVGGRNKIVIADLRQAVADLGYDNVETYINGCTITLCLLMEKKRLSKTPRKPVLMGSLW